MTDLDRVENYLCEIWETLKRIASALEENNRILDKIRKEREGFIPG